MDHKIEQRTSPAGRIGLAPVQNITFHFRYIKNLFKCFFFSFNQFGRINYFFRDIFLLFLAPVTAEQHGKQLPLGQESTDSYVALIHNTSWTTATWTGMSLLPSHCCCAERLCGERGRESTQALLQGSNCSHSCQGRISPIAQDTGCMAAWERKSIPRELSKTSARLLELWGCSP